MSYDYSELFDQIISAVRMTGSISERITTVVDYCAEQSPHPDWLELENIDYSGDLLNLDPWLVTALVESKTPVKGLWFGLNNPEIGNEPTADIYVAGSTEFTHPKIEWTEYLSHSPSGYLNSRVLGAIYKTAYSDNGLGNRAEYPLALAYGAMAACSALERLDLRIVPGLEGVAVGFDSGDLMFLGGVENGRFKVEVVPG